MNVEELKAAWPTMFAPRVDLEIPPGWVPLVYSLCDKLQQLLLAEAVDLRQLTVVQVKEKFGLLRFYYRTEAISTQLSEAIIREVLAAEAASKEICPRCGDVAHQRCQRG